MNSTKPLRDLDDPEVEATFKATSWPAGGMRLGARRIRIAEPGTDFIFSDGTRATETWRSIIQVDSLEYDIAFGPETTKEAAVAEANRLGKEIGGSPLPRVKGAAA